MRSADRRGGAASCPGRTTTRSFEWLADCTGPTEPHRAGTQAAPGPHPLAGIRDGQRTCWQYFGVTWVSESDQLGKVASGEAAREELRDEGIRRDRRNSALGGSRRVAQRRTPVDPHHGARG